MLTKRPLQGNTHDGDLSAKPLPVTPPNRDARACPERCGILGAGGLARYGRYKARLWRHTHDTLVSQNDRSPVCQAGSLLRREREFMAAASLLETDGYRRVSDRRGPD